MLVLSRSIGQKIVIGSGPDAITLTLVDVVDGRKARIGIEAPRSTPIFRQELLPLDPPGDRLSLNDGEKQGDSH